MGRIQEENNTIWVEWCKKQKLEPITKEIRTVEKLYFKFTIGEYKGFIGYTYWASVKRNSIMRLSCLTEESKIDYVNSIANKKGLELYGKLGTYKQKSKYRYVGEDYKYKNCIIETNIENLRRLDSVEIRGLTEASKKKYFDNIANERGYKVIEYPNKLSAKNHCVLESPEGNEWYVNWNSFATNITLNCPKDIGTSRSYGENIVGIILKDMGIAYRTEVPVKTKSQRHQRLDFYIEHQGQKYAIEYMGKQHYIQSTGSWKTPLEIIQKRDKFKKEYCIENNIKLLYIPYTTVKYEEVKKEIEKLLNKE